MLEEKEAGGYFCRMKKGEKAPNVFLVLVVAGWVRGEGFSAKALERRLPFVVRVRMPLARTQRGSRLCAE